MNKLTKEKSEVFISVMPEEHIRQRMLAIVKGEYKPEPGEPKIWFTSVNTLAQILSKENFELLRVMEEQECKHDFEPVYDLGCFTGFYECVKCKATTS